MHYNKFDSFTFIAKILLDMPSIDPEFQALKLIATTIAWVSWPLGMQGSAMGDLICPTYVERMFW